MGRRQLYPTLLVLVCLSSCDYYHHRPNNVPLSAKWVDHVFIDCSAEKQWDADRCTVYKGDTGQILADGIWILNTTFGSADPSTLHYIAYGHGTIYFDDAQFLMLTSPSEKDPQVLLLKQLATHGDAQAIDCNLIPNNSQISELSKCALNAFAVRRPFYVKYYEPGIGSSIYHALAGDSQGNVTEIDYYSMGYSTHNLPVNAQLFDDHHIIVMPCPDPVNLMGSTDGTLFCERPPTSFK
ncbi:MAG TPA: hypothetical protein VKB26_01560 [Candidatus Acidoferrales bacterium]|nr:hypothetical protein [Candidatus Acidoferrales bacterium]